jgi:hypothetical protein
MFLNRRSHHVNRRVHRKSRLGCQECKQRRIKCDESHPACGNCISTRRNCPYLTDGAASFTKPTSKTVQASAHPPSSALVVALENPRLLGSSSPVDYKSFVNIDTSRTGTLPACSSAHLSNGAQSSNLDLLNGFRESQSYSLHHLELLHYFVNDVAQALGDDQSLGLNLSGLIVKQGFAVPFLMDQILALSAAHTSIKHNGEPKEFYLREATELQIRALAGFNRAQAELGSANHIAIFLFSSLLSQHTLFDTFSSQTDLSAVLDRFVNCLGLHRGIRAVTSESAPTIRNQIQAQLGKVSNLSGLAGSYAEFDAGKECAGILSLLDQGSLGVSEAEIYRDAIAVLQRMFDIQRDNQPDVERKLQLVRVVHEWPVTVSTSYANFLEQRRPEALIILAFYAVLLHFARFYWAIPTAGRFLVHSISAHLGSYWANWLEWPNKMVQNSVPWWI